jgi:hypothetical protein
MPARAEKAPPATPATSSKIRERSAIWVTPATGRSGPLYGDAATACHRRAPPRLASRAAAAYKAGMILLTGGAGFIGSCLNAALQRQGRDVTIVDRLGSDGKWRNLAHAPPQRLVPPEALDPLLTRAGVAIKAVVHRGAISETTARDGDLVWSSNVALSQTLELVAAEEA